MKAVQGVLSVPNTQYDATGDPKKKLTRLFVYESTCIYSDRLVDEFDKHKFKNMISKIIDKHALMNLQDVLQDYSEE